MADPVSDKGKTLVMGNPHRGEITLTPEIGGTIEVTVDNPHLTHSEDSGTMRLARSEARRLWAKLGQELGL